MNHPSPQALPTEQLRSMKCAMCKDDSDCNDIVLAARCHPQAGVSASSHGSVLAILCHECDQLVVELTAPTTLDMSHAPLYEKNLTCDCGGEIFVVDPHCHPGGPVDLLYQKSSHALVVRCKVCESVAGTIPLTTLS